MRLYNNCNIVTKPTVYRNVYHARSLIVTSTIECLFAIKVVTNGPSYLALSTTVIQIIKYKFIDS